MKVTSKTFAAPLEGSARATESLFYPECGPMPYESIYSIYLKFSHLNCIKLSSLGGALNVASEQQWSDHVLTGWLESSVANIDNHLPWRYVPYKYIYHNGLGGFRFCEECVRFGYHSVFNSILTHNVCALHKCSLKKACVHCAKVYLRGFRSDSSIPHYMSKCSGCGFQVIGFAREIRMRHSLGLLGALEEFGLRQAEWYESIFNVDLVYFNNYCEQEEQREYLTGSFEALTKLKSPEALAGFPQDSQTCVFLKLDRESDFRQFDPEAQVAICRRLETRHLGGHLNCLKSLNEMIRYPDGAEMIINLCPISLAYLLLRIKGVYGDWPVPGSISINLAGMIGISCWGGRSDPVSSYRSAFLLFLSILGRLQYHISKGCDFAILCRSNKRLLILGESERVIIKKPSSSFRNICRCSSSDLRLFRDGVGGPIVVMMRKGRGSPDDYLGIKRVIF